MPPSAKELREKHFPPALLKAWNQPDPAAGLRHLAALAAAASVVRTTGSTEPIELLEPAEIPEPAIATPAPRPELPPGVKYGTAGKWAHLEFRHAPSPELRQKLKLHGWRWYRGLWRREHDAGTIAWLTRLFAQLVDEEQLHELRAHAQAVELATPWTPDRAPVATAFAWPRYVTCRVCQSVQRVTARKQRQAAPRVGWHRRDGKRCPVSGEPLQFPVPLRDDGKPWLRSDWQDFLYGRDDSERRRIVAQSKRVQFDEVMRICVLGKAQHYTIVPARKAAVIIKWTRKYLRALDAFDLGQMKLTNELAFFNAVLSQAHFAPIAIEGSCCEAGDRGNTTGELLAALPGPEIDTHWYKGGRRPREDPDAPYAPGYVRQVLREAASVEYVIREGERIRTQDLDHAKIVTEQKMIEGEWRSYTPAGKRQRPSDGRQYPRRFGVSHRRMSCKELRRIDGGLFDRVVLAMRKACRRHKQGWLWEQTEPVRKHVRSMGLKYREALVTSADDLKQAIEGAKLRAAAEAARANRPQGPIDPVKSLSPLRGVSGNEKTTSLDFSGGSHAGGRQVGTGPP